MTDLQKIRKMAYDIATNARLLNGETDGETVEYGIMDIATDVEKLVKTIDALILAELITARV